MGTTPPVLTATPASTMDRWLTSRPRRMLVVAGGVLIVSGLSTHLWLDAAAEMGWSVDGTQIFLRRLLRWGLWGACPAGRA